MITGLSGATIWSQDLNNLLPFYRDTIGLPVAVETAGFVVLGSTEGPNLALGTHSDVRGAASDPYRHFVGLGSTDLDADFERLSAAGVEFLEQPTDYDGLKIATLKDPEGNVVQLFEPTTM